MYCEKCGNPINKDSKFCAHCGTRTESIFPQTPKPLRDTSNAIFSCKPVFITPAVLIGSIIFGIYNAIFGGIFFGMASIFVLKVVKTFQFNIPVIIPLWLPFVFFGLLFLFGSSFLTYFRILKTYSKTDYKFYPDRLEYSEGFWTVENKTIRYEKITETSLRRGVIQKKYGLGTIFLATPATGFLEGKSRSGISINDIANPEKVYAEIQGLIGK
jgi:membrane protein YdbS with pleckstrin-like domain